VRVLSGVLPSPNDDRNLKRVIYLSHSGIVEVMPVRSSGRRLKRPRDPLALAKLIGDIATGQVQDRQEDTRNPAAVELGRLGGLKGGKARAAKLTPKKRSAIARKAASARWSKR